MQASSQHCLERQRLLDQVKSAIAELMSIHNEELEGVLRGEIDISPESIRKRLGEARERKAALVERLRMHISEHRC